jgi:hypothetical protein
MAKAEYTRYVELITKKNIAKFAEPVPKFYVAFDEMVDTAGFSEIRLWACIRVINSVATPILGNAKVNVQFIHQRTSDNIPLAYSQDVITSKMTSDIYGFLAIPIIGNSVEILGNPVNMPPGPYDLYVTYYLVR